MSQPDPDDTPTRHGDEQPTRHGGEQPTRAGGDRSRPTPRGPEEKTQAAPEDHTLPALDAKKPAPRAAPPAGGKPAPAPAAGPRANEPQDPMLGKTLGGCRLTKLLGKGAMGAVYKARQEKLDRDVAIKVIRPEMMTDQRMLKRFEVEARTVAKFNSAHVVLVHDVGFELGVHYLVMEFVEGKNLRDHVKLLAGGRLPAGEALPLLRQAIRGLEEAQRLAVVHRDIKPDNLMLTERGTLKIADFGIAKPLTEDFSMTLTSELVGTPLYMSPEQCQGRAEIDFRSDMYSLGATFFYLLTGEPPIRASSVYELIATKTKMAHLCLWKALPGLDENNPLSRVIERMTELGREDRYPSYEALLNDLVLVEQGQTIVPKPKPIRTAPAGDEAQTRVTVRERGKGAAEPASHRGRLVVGALVLLAAIGGGYVWINQPGTPPDTGARVAAELDKLRQRLATDGPSQPLLEELGKVPAVRPEHVAERGKLIDDVEVGLRVEAALAAILKPAKLELPFDDLARFLEAVDRAAEPQPRPGKAVGGEVTSFCKRQREVARSEGELGALGLSTLATTFADWKERVRQNADEALVPEFEKQLDGVLAARVALYERLLSVRDLLNKEFPVDKLEEARQALRAGTMAGGGDVSESLTRIRAAFAVEGPIPSLLADANKLRPSDARQREEVNALVDAMGIAKTAADNATQIKADRFPEKPALPFDAVEEYLAAIARAFAPVRTPDGQYPEWAAAQMATLCARDTLQQKVVAACIAAWTEWQGAGAKGPDAVAGVALVRKAKAKAIELFPASKQELDAAIAETAMADADSKVMRAGKRQQWLAEAGSLASKLALVTTLGEWVAGGPAVETALAALRTSAAELGGDAEVAGTLKQLGDNAARWVAAVAALTATDQQLAAGELSAATKLARAGAAGNEGRAEFMLAGEVAELASSAFETLTRTLDITAAETTLREAAGKLRGAAGLPGAPGRLESWLAALRRLRDATSGMVPIQAGRPKGAAAPVEPFFLAATECSREQFAQFVADLNREVAGITDAQQRFAKVGGRLAGSGITAERLTELLAREVKADKLPVENVTWYAAAAFAAWRGCTLPTEQQWRLAAFGDGGKFTYPWGNDWPPDSKARSANNQNAVEVETNGLSWRANEGVRIHHLGGNVAEWLASDPDAIEGRLIGSRYNDGDASAREYAAGGTQRVDKPDGRKGFGFRTALALKSFPGLDWPR